MSTLPEGAIARIEPQPSHEIFLEAARPEWVCIKINHMRQLVKNGHDADSYTPEGTKVLGTTTINDRELSNLSWEDEREILADFQPDAHVPTDVSVYPEMEFADRIEGIRDCMEGVLYMHHQLADLGISMIPLIKGLSYRERDICYRALERLDHNHAAVYVTRYFTAYRGNNRNKLLSGVETIAGESTANLVLIGLLSPNYLDRMPPSVEAAAGMNAWRDRVTPTKAEASEISGAYERLETDVRTALDLGLTVSESVTADADTQISEDETGGEREQGRGEVAVE